MKTQSDKAIREIKRQKFSEVVNRICIRRDLPIPSINFEGCEYEDEDQLAHYHPELNMICVSDYQLMKLDFNDIEEVATHEVTHILVRGHDSDFRGQEAISSLSGFKPESGVVHIEGSDHKSTKNRKIRTDRTRCNYHLCRKKTKLKQCKYCKNYYCHEHTQPYKPSVGKIAGTEQGHPCFVYARSEYKREKEGRASADLTRKNTKKEEPVIFNSREIQKCAYCKNELQPYCFRCRHCKNYFCSKCRLPEDHECRNFEKGNIFRRLSDKKPESIQKQEPSIKRPTYRPKPITETESPPTKPHKEPIKWHRFFKHWKLFVFLCLLVTFIFYFQITPDNIRSLSEKGATETKIVPSGQNVPYQPGGVITKEMRCQYIGDIFVGTPEEKIECSKKEEVIQTKPIIKNNERFNELISFISDIKSQIGEMVGGAGQYIEEKAPEVQKTVTEVKEAVSFEPLDTHLLERKVHDLINVERNRYGISSLGLDSELSDIARKHSQDMIDRDFFAHVNPSGLDPTQRGNLADYSCYKNYGSYYTKGIAENIFSTFFRVSVMGCSDSWSEEGVAECVVNGWMNSPGHRQNILTANYGAEGIGVAVSSGGHVLVTEDFC